MRKLRKLLWGRIGGRRVTTTVHSVATRRPTRRMRRRSQKTVGERMAGAFSPLVRSSIRLLPYALIAVAAASLPVFGYKLYVNLMTSPHLALANVEIAGCQRLDSELVRKAANLVPGENLLNLDEEAVSERLRWQPWIKRVHVERQLPDTVRIEIVEREVAAILVGEKTFLVDRDGYLFKEMEEADYDPELLVIVGLNATQLVKMGEERRVRQTLTEIMTVKREYETMGLSRYYPVAEVHWDDVSGMTLVAAGRQRFVLGTGDFPAKLRRLGEVLAHLQRNGSGVEEIRLDNEKHPSRVAVAGSTIELRGRRAVTAIPEAGIEMLP
jgi:cell division septal protein FtsQ